MSDIANSAEYNSFRGTVPMKKFIVDDDQTKEWALYDAGPKSVRCPMICFPPASGTADVYFRQLLALSAHGYRVEYPVYWTMKEFCDGFRKLLDHLQLDRVHLFGSSLGGFLAQKFTEFTHLSPRVASLILCNSFYDTSIFQQTNSAPTFWMMPALILKKMVMGNFEKGPSDPSICDSVDFLVEKLDNLSQQQLASRLTLNCMNCYVEPQKVSQVPITILDVFDDCALSFSAREEMYKCYPDAKKAHLKSGGNFPYLSRCDEVNIFIQIHLKQFQGTRYNASDSVLLTEEDESSREYHNVRISPAPDTNPDIIEIRKGRYLRIQHFNKRKRDGRFEKEMQMFMEYKRTGMLPNIATHMSIRRTNSKRTSAHSTPDKGTNIDQVSHSNIPNEVPADAINSLPNGSTNNERPLTEKSITSGYSVQTPNRGLSRTSHAETQSVMSSSNVTISMDQQVKRIDLGHIGKTNGPTIDEGGESDMSHSKQSLADKSPLHTQAASKFSGKEIQNNGIDTGMVLFFIHGVGGSSDVWKSQIEYFAEIGYEIVCPDMIGHGLSCAPDRKQAYHFDEILADIDEIFDKYCKRKNVIVGHSYGCAFATVLARQRSSRIHKLILVSGGGPNPLAPQPGVFSLPLCMLSCIKPCLSCCFQRRAFKSGSELPVSKETTFAIPTYVLSYIMNGQFWPDGDDMYHSWIAVSTLLIYGRHDIFVSLQEEEEMNKVIYGSKLEVVERAGHMVMIETPDVFNQIVHSFIDENWAPLSSSQQAPNTEMDEGSSSLPERSQTPYTDRLPSRASHLSIRSAKSTKSTKSMPRGMLSVRS
ncbi:uncharacterized protein LOC132550635 [Ylistrum balloti]|uniref:uncharacterized protein LOC132550635 n=1 Tax=Ylistrum balloti TaxID=509963 RepID=UPI002905C651|nr:uncharacterized protein LOC132550635 [Ylistrum balloti]